MPSDAATVPKDCSKLRSAVDTAAGVTGTLWLSFVFLQFYVLLAIVGVSHADQFLQNSVKLPFLQIELPLLGFLWIGPVIVLLAHAYVLHHLTLLAATARLLNACEKDNPSSDEDLLGISLFAQILSGSSEKTDISAWWVEQVIVWATLVVGPLLTLMYFELQFLPFHYEPTTWWARIGLLGDLALLRWMWPRAICRTKPGWFTPALAPWGLSLMIALAAVTTYVAIPLATFPGERLETWLPRVPGYETLIVGIRETGGDKLLRQPLWPNRLFVRGIDVIDHAKYDSPAKLVTAPITKSMRDRNLEYAIIIEAQLGRVDFSGADLKGASLVRAHATGAWFDHADLSGAQLDYAELQGASFFAARMAGVTMDNVQIQGGILAGANLIGAWLKEARLDGASLAGSDLRYATLDKAWLMGANLSEARLQNASLADTHLEGASLDNAYVWRADFSRAEAERGLSRLNVDNHQEAVCQGPPDHACTVDDTPASVKELIRSNIPNRDGPERDSRKPMFDRLDLSLSPDQPPSWEKASQDQLANFKPLYDQDLPDLWKSIACISKGAPYIIATLIDTYVDKGWTRPKTREDTRTLIKYLQDQENCTASAVVTSDSMKMDLRDLWLLRLPAKNPSTDYSAVTPYSPPAAIASPPANAETVAPPDPPPPVPAPPPR